MKEQYRCLVNEGLPSEWVAAGNTRDEVERMVLKAETEMTVSTKRFFKIKEDNQT